jgi:hypothetical protein
MSDPQTIAAARALRDEALTIVRADLELAKAEASPARIKERAIDEAVTMIDTVRDVANENKTIIAAVVAALTGWFLRGSLIDLAKGARDAVRSGD